MAPITIVAGLGRCGSSLVMQMLAAGGHPIYGPDNARAPAFEHENATLLPDISDWLADAAGQAVKILDPHRHRLPYRYSYRVIWCDRDPDEQAKSQCKFLAYAVCIAASRAERRAMAASNRRDKLRSWATIGGLQDARMMVVVFEDLIRDPIGQAERISAFVGLPEAAKKMAAVVRPRSPKCLEGMLELAQLAEIGL
jgi:hypothetical protein